jgi:hypothetical protein
MIFKHQNSPLGAALLLAPRAGRMSVLAVLPARCTRPPDLAILGFAVCDADDADDADGSLLWLRVERFARIWTSGAASACGVFPRVRTIVWSQLFFLTGR